MGNIAAEYAPFVVGPSGGRRVADGHAGGLRWRAGARPRLARQLEVKLYSRAEITAA